MRHRFHSICPYFAMFPEQFVEKHLVWSQIGDIVFDPFSGRGTTILQSLLRGRQAAGCDTNPVAVCLSNAKADPPDRPKVVSRLHELRAVFCERSAEDPEWQDPFFITCFHRRTLAQLLFLRDELDWRSCKEDRFIAALCLGSLHGESHKSPRYFSNRMPRTIATKPDYSLRWWRERGCRPPARNVFSILDEMIDFRFGSTPASLRGRVAEGDAREAAKHFPDLRGRVSLVVTSPPYLDTTDYAEDQWLRLWFLGGPPFPQRRVFGDDRHRREDGYWTFLEEAWRGVGPLLSQSVHIVVRLGGRRLDGRGLNERLCATMERGLDRQVSLCAESSSMILNSQTRVVRPSTSRKRSTEHDFHFKVH